MTQDLTYRALSLPLSATGAPSTLDIENRSVEAIGATENPVMERDYDTYEVYPTVLLMSGCRIPPSGQLPLLDSHSRYSTSTVIGSYRDMRVEGDKLIGRAVYSTAPESESPWLKTMEGHLTDYSVARKDVQATIIPAGQAGIVAGRTWQGPVKVVTDWIPKEMSACPIGADENAKARSEQITPKKKEKNMEETRSEVTIQQPPVDLDAVRAEATRDENRRLTEIDAMCVRFDISGDKRAELVKPAVSVDAARKAIMDVVFERSAANTPGARIESQTETLRSVQVGTDERDKFRSAAEDSLLIRSGNAPAKSADGASDLAGFSMRELARESLRVSGRATGGDAREMVGRALTTSDFPLILANIANKSLFAGYAAAAETWQQWCGVGSVSDFKTNTIVRAGETADLDQIREDDEYKYGSRTEAQEQFQISTYGKLFAISRQTIINDDLGALTDIPASHGEAAGRKIGDLAYAVLTANAAMGDGTALFHANHGNLGTSGVIGSTTFAEAFKLMLLQKDIGGKRRLNIKPQFLIIPPSLSFAAETFIKTQLIGTQATPNQPNIYAGTVQIVSEARLYDDSATAWYLAGDKGKTVNLFFLNGSQAPFMETKQGWDVDGVEYKVRIDAGAKAVDWKSLLKNAGA
jgi:hypothetical protein